jgi:hypothetical protein
MLSLPSAVTTHQISFLCPQDILNFGATCHHFYEIVHQDLTLAILGKEQFALPIEKATKSFYRFIDQVEKSEEFKGKKPLHKFCKCLHYHSVGGFINLIRRIPFEIGIEDALFSIYSIFLLDLKSQQKKIRFLSLVIYEIFHQKKMELLPPLLKRLNLFDEIEAEKYSKFLDLIFSERWEIQEPVAEALAAAYGDSRPLSIMERLIQIGALEKNYYQGLEESIVCEERLKLLSQAKVATRRNDFNHFINAAVLELKERGFFTEEEYKPFLDQWLDAQAEFDLKGIKIAFKKVFTLPIKIAVILKAIKEDKQSIIDYLSNYLDSFSYMELLLSAKKDDRYLGLFKSGIACVSNFKISTLLKFAQDSGHSHFVTRISNELLSPQSIKKGRELLVEFVNEFPDHPFSSRVTRALREADIRDGMTPIRNVWDQAREILASIFAPHNQKKL